MGADFFWKIVKKEVDRQRTSFEWLCRKTKIPKGTFASWKNRGIIPRADKALCIAEALKVSVEYLLTGVEHNRQPSNPAAHEIAKTIPLFDDYDLQTLLATAQAMAARYSQNKPSGIS
jgi:transcriptional regulator with XRE-family HTH domain